MMTCRVGVTALIGASLFCQACVGHRARSSEQNWRVRSAQTSNGASSCPGRWAGGRIQPSCLPGVGRCSGGDVILLESPVRFGRNARLLDAPSSGSRLVGLAHHGQPAMLLGPFSIRRIGKTDWACAATFDGWVGWTRRKELIDIGRNWSGDRPQGSGVGNRHGGKRLVLRLATWSARSWNAKDYGKLIVRAMDRHRIDAAFLQGIRCDKAGNISSVARLGPYRFKLGNCRDRRMTVGVVWRVDTVDVRPSALHPTPVHSKHVVVAYYRLRSHGVPVEVANVGWFHGRENRGENAREMTEVIRLLAKMKSAANKGLLVAGTWPTWPLGQASSYERLLPLARRLSKRGIHVLPVLWSCSGYQRDKPELTEFFVWWGSGLGLNRKAYSVVHGTCALHQCCYRSKSETENCRSGDGWIDCPITADIGLQLHGLRTAVTH